MSGVKTLFRYWRNLESGKCGGDMEGVQWHPPAAGMGNAGHLEEMSGGNVMYFRWFIGRFHLASPGIPTTSEYYSEAFVAGGFSNFFYNSFFQGFRFAVSGAFRYENKVSGRLSECNRYSSESLFRCRMRVRRPFFGCRFQVCAGFIGRGFVLVR